MSNVDTSEARRVPRWRTIARWTVTSLAGLLVLLVLVAPSQMGHLTPVAFLRIPVEALLVVALVLVLPERRRLTAIVAGIVLGVLGVLKVVDMGFFAVLDRPFDPMGDWSFLDAAAVYLTKSSGRAVAVGFVIGAVVLAVLLVVLVTLAVLRLSRLVAAHRSVASRTVAALAVVWVAFAVVGVRVGPGEPVAARASVDRLLQVRAGLQDRSVFAAESAVDNFRDSSSDLLTALRGKDVIIAFVESYGRVALEDPVIAPQVSAVLDDGSRRLTAAGYSSRSGYLTSPTAGGGSWLAQATLLSGLWVDNQQRYGALTGTDHLTLNGAFRRAGWRTVGIMPGVIQEWPESKFYDLDQIYAAKDLGYRGPNFSFATMPDQYALSFFQRTERAKPDHAPVMAEIPLISSHAPWAPVPPFLDWDAIGDGSVYQATAGAGDPADIVLRRDRTRVRNDYANAISYSLKSLISYVELYGDDNLVVVFLGDHQPAPVVAGAGASRDVPITIVARDPAVLDRIAGWGWQDGLKPAPQSPVWRMDTFRDRFLTAFGPTG